MSAKLLCRNLGIFSSLYFKRFYCFIIMSCILGGFAYPSNVCTIVSPEAGKLVLPAEAYVATRLKIVGNINAHDFQTLKDVTMNRTRELDLSEAVIRYSTEDGCFSPITSDWVVGNEPTKDEYYANTLPIHAFTEVCDNSISKYHSGSSSLVRIILPKNIASIETDAFLKMSTLAELEVPKYSATATSVDNIVYSKDMSTLIGIAPCFTGELELNSLTKNVAEGVLKDKVVSGLVIRSAEKVEFGKDNNADIAYIVSSNSYDDVFPGVDCVNEINEIVVNDVSEGMLMSVLGQQGFSRSDVRKLKVFGRLNSEDMSFLCSLPHLYHLDISGSSFSDETLTISSESLCTIKFPSGNYRLYIKSCKFLGGDLVVPEGVVSFSCPDFRFRSLVMPSTLVSCDKLSSTFLRDADFSACVKLEELNVYAKALENIQLPVNLRKITINAPVAQLELPDAIEELSCSGIEAETLVLPKSICRFEDSNNMMYLRSLDASNAKKLVYVERALSDCPRLETVDFTSSPLKTFKGLDASLLTSDIEGEVSVALGNGSTRAVVVGGTRFPALSYSSLKALYLPSTITQISGLDNCEKLEQLDLFNCYQLTSLSGLNNASSLSILKLPVALSSIEGLSGSSSLSTIYSAAFQPAIFTSSPEEGLLERVSLYVPDDYVGIYRMSEYWEKCANIYEGGYSVVVYTDFDDTNPVYGSGLYAHGEAASICTDETIEENSVIKFDFLKWTADGYPAMYSAEASFVPESHVKFHASYVGQKPDLAAGDIYFCLNASEQTTHTIRIYSSCFVYDKNGWVASGPGEMSLKLEPGENEFAVAGDNIYDINLNYKYYEQNVDVKLEDFVVKNPGNVKNLGIAKLNVETFDINSFVYLNQFNCQRNQLNKLDLNGLHYLEYLDCSLNKLDDLDLSDCVNLKYLSCLANKLQKLDVKNCSHLEQLYCSNNKIEILESLNLPNLQYFSGENNHFAFSQISNDLYRAYVKDDDEVSLFYCDLPSNQLYKGDVLDLSRELFDKEGNPVEISISSSHDPLPLNISEGMYKFISDGDYKLVFTNNAMPDMVINSNFWVNYSNGINDILTDMKINIEGLNVKICGLNENTYTSIVDASGNTVARCFGFNAEFTVNMSGVYIINFRNGDETASIKVFLK
mgnify:FL=1